MPNATAERSSPEEFHSPQRPPFGYNAPYVIAPYYGTGQGKFGTKAICSDKHVVAILGTPFPSLFKLYKIGYGNAKLGANISPNMDIDTGGPTSRQGSMMLATDRTKTPSAASSKLFEVNATAPFGDG
jgi:hypothetical protein